MEEREEKQLLEHEGERVRAEVEEGKRERERLEEKVEELKKEVAGKADNVQGKTKMIAKVCPCTC